MRESEKQRGNQNRTQGTIVPAQSTEDEASESQFLAQSRQDREDQQDRPERSGSDYLIDLYQHLLGINAQLEFLLDGCREYQVDGMETDSQDGREEEIDGARNFQP